jgi:hypothetical protein
MCNNTSLGKADIGSIPVAVFFLAENITSFVLFAIKFCSCERQTKKRKMGVSQSKPKVLKNVSDYSPEDRKDLLYHNLQKY